MMKSQPTGKEMAIYILMIRTTKLCNVVGLGLSIYESQKSLGAEFELIELFVY